MGRRDVQGKAVLKTGPEQPPTLRARWGEGMGSDLPTHGLGNRLFITLDSLKTQRDHPFWLL